MRNFFIVGLILFSTVFSTLKSQNVTVEGVGENIGGRTVRLLCYADRISFLEKELGTTIVPAGDSCFTFKLTIPAPIQVLLRIEMYDYVFIIEPGKEYSLRVDSFMFEMENEYINPLLYEIPLPVYLELDADKQLNRNVWMFDSIMDDYLSLFHQEMLLYRKRPLMDSLRGIVDFLFDGDSTSYFFVYGQSFLASLAYACHFTSRERVIRQLLLPTVLYDNVGYMDLFDLCFSQYFTEGHGKLRVETISYWIDQGMYRTLIDSLGIDPLLQDEVFRELVFLSGMREAFFSKNYHSASVLRMLHVFAQETKFSKHRAIAENLQRKLRHAKPKGDFLSDFDLRKIDSSLVQLSSYIGKPLYISFVKTQERASLLELETMSHFYETREDDCVFISIACDRELATMHHFLKNTKRGAKYTWEWLHFDKNFALLERYGARVFPFFVAVDAEGKIVASPAPKPSEGGFKFSHTR